MKKPAKPRSWLCRAFSSCWGPDEEARRRNAADELIAGARSAFEINRRTLPGIKDLAGFRNYCELAENLFLADARDPNARGLFIPPYDSPEATSGRAEKLSSYAVGPTCIAVIDNTGEMYLTSLWAMDSRGTGIPMEKVLQGHGFEKGGWVNPVSEFHVPLTRQPRDNLARYNTKMHARFQSLFGRQPLPLQQLRAIAGDRRAKTRDHAR
ncbi:MAG: hypothetical protein EBQ96_08530 [Proteobacteria bacterium]|nr:hypothetical protein [Pseudomonadota bacterium]